MLDNEKERAGDALLGLGNRSKFRASSDRSFVFYSAINYCIEASHHGKSLDDEMFSHSFIDYRGRIVRGNYVGELINGFPGSMLDGVLTRPPHYITYKLIGELIAPLQGRTLAKGQLISDPMRRPSSSLKIPQALLHCFIDS